MKVETVLISESNEEISLSALFKETLENSLYLFEQLNEDHFTKNEFIIIFNAIKKVVSEGGDITAANVFPIISDSATSVAVLQKLVDSEYVGGSYEAAYEIINNKRKLRKLNETIREVQSELGKSNTDPDYLYEQLHKLIVDSEEIGETESVSSVLQELFPDLDDINPVGKYLGIPTGLPSLDSLTLGLQKNQLVIIGARPSTGKTELALQMSVNCALRENKPVIFVSLETDKTSVVNRILSHILEIDLQKIKMKNFTPEEKQRIKDNMDKVGKMPLYVIDDPIMSVPKLSAKLRKYKYKLGDLGLVVVDYLQLMKGTNAHRVLEIGEISRGLKILAKQLQVPVIALSQLSRAIETRNDSYDRPPKMSDLRESGTIENDADVIIFMTAEPSMDEHGNYIKNRETYLWVEKQKDGPRGQVKCTNYCNIGTIREQQDNVFGDNLDWEM